MFKRLLKFLGIYKKENIKCVRGQYLVGDYEPPADDFKALLHVSAFEEPYTDSDELRSFSSDVTNKELIWHFDLEDRTVEVIEANGWSLQRDNSLPVLLNDGDIFKIKADQWHRVVKGCGNLVLKITVEGA